MSQFPNGSNNGSNIYNENTYRRGLKDLKGQLTSEPNVVFNGATITFNLSCKGGGSEYWIIENKSVTLPSDKSTRMIYAHSDTGTVDNVTLKSFVISGSSYEITDNGANLPIATIQGNDSDTLLLLFDGYCAFKITDSAFNMFISDNQNFEMFGEYGVYGSNDKIYCDFYGSDSSERHLILENNFARNSSSGIIAQIKNVNNANFSVFEVRGYSCFIKSTGKYHSRIASTNTTLSNATNESFVTKSFSNVSLQTKPSLFVTTNGVKLANVEMNFTNLGKGTVIAVYKP